MNAEDYKNFKEFVVELDNTQVYNFFEILVDEINYRKLKITKDETPQNGSRKI